MYLHFKVEPDIRVAAKEKYNMAYSRKYVKRLVEDKVLDSETIPTQSPTSHVRFVGSSHVRVCVTSP